MTARHASRFVVGLAVCGALGFAAQRTYFAVGPAADSDGLESGQAMQIRLNAVTLALTDYLQSHRPDDLNTVKSQGKAATGLLERFKAEASAAAPAVPTLVERVEFTHNAQREAVLAILNADAQQQQARAALDASRQQVLDALNEKFLANAKAAAWHGSDRLRWIWTAWAEARVYMPPLDGSAAPTEDRFRVAMNEFGRQTSSRQMGLIAEVLARWEACRAAGRAVADQERAKRTALATFAQARGELDQAIDDYRRAAAGPHAAGTSSAAVAWVLCALCGIFGLAVGAWVWRDEARAGEDNGLRDALNDIVACVEAATTGDLSRAPVASGDPTVERLSSALSRLNGVLTRSENLVYHLAALVEMSGDAIISQTLDGTILSWNKGAQRLYGYAIDDVRGHSIGILSPNDGGTELRTVLERVKSGEKVAPFETLHQAKNGRLVRALVKAAAVHDSLHHVIGVSFCAQELSAPATSATAIPYTDTFQRS